MSEKTFPKDSIRQNDISLIESQKKLTFYSAFGKRGFTEVYALKGGWDEWTEAGYPKEPLSAG
jgi:rhodanese-related sulfurtransferase